mgnify:CR=1 FL=1
MTDLLDIPSFLQRAIGDRPEVKPAGRRRFKMPKHRPCKKTPAKTVSDGTRAILNGQGWPNNLIDMMTGKDATQFADTGRMMTPADEMRVRRS